MLSLLMPTRQRPHNVQRLWDSIVDTAYDLKNIELVVYIDEDDHSYDKLKVPMVKVRGPRIVLSEMWNKCYIKSKGPYSMHLGDDIVFRTKHWDKIVLDKFKEFPDRIVFVHGDDGGPNGKGFGTHGFIHQNWVNAVGYFVPPYFSSDYNDTWLNDVANMVGRRAYVDILTEHMHPAFNKAPVDQNHMDRLDRHAKDNVGTIYAQKSEERKLDAEKLRSVML